MVKVMVFGSFDVLHKGHFFVLDKAQSLGKLYIVLARDDTILKIKNQTPHFSAETRKKQLQKKYPKATIYIGHKIDKLHWIKKVKPNLFILGYDQKMFVDKLKIYCNKQPDCEIKVLGSHKPHKYKSSIVKKNNFLLFLRRFVN